VPTRARERPSQSGWRPATPVESMPSSQTARAVKLVAEVEEGEQPRYGARSLRESALMSDQVHRGGAGLYWQLEHYQGAHVRSHRSAVAPRWTGGRSIPASTGGKQERSMRRPRAGTLSGSGYAVREGADTNSVRTRHTEPEAFHRSQSCPCRAGSSGTRDSRGMGPRRPAPRRQPVTSAQTIQDRAANSWPGGDPALARTRPSRM